MMKYSKIIWYMVGAFLLFLIASCSPQESNNGALGPIVPASQFKLDVHATTDGGNQIVMVNNTPHVAGMWVTGIGTSTKQTDTVLLPFLGKNKIYFYGTTSGGVVEDSTSIAITKIDHALSQTWSDLAGTGSKTWVWALDLPANWVPQGNPAGGCYGIGGSYVMNVGSWWPGSGTPAQLQSDGVANDSMNFNLNGGPNFILYTGNTQTSNGSPVGLPAGTYQGTFKFNMSNTIKSDATPGATGGDLWSIGTLDLSGGVTVSLGIQPNNGNIPVYHYNILYLDSNVMILAAPQPDGEFDWGSCWFWIFKRKGYSFTGK